MISGSQLIYFRALLLALFCGLGYSLLPVAARGVEVPEAVRRAEEERIAAIKKGVTPSISVFARGGRGGGSGVVITPDGYALSNYHVVKPAGSAMQCSMPDGKLYNAVVVGIDPVGDVALIKLLGRDDFPTAEIADSDKVQAGDWCFAVGNPFLLATDFQPTVTWGIVSGVHRYQYPAGTLLEYADCIQTDASINPGNSGGPLFNAGGQLIGINGRGSFEKRGRVNVGVGYAISINQIQHFMGYLKSGRIVDHATLGATVTTREDDGAVVVNNVSRFSDAYRRGLRYGDRIAKFGGRQITTVNGFKNVLGIFPKGWRIPLTYQREDQERTILVRLEGVHSREELISKVQPRRAMPMPQPKKEGDEDKKEEGDGKKKGEGKDDQDKRVPIPIRRLMQRKAPMPDVVKRVFKARSGYANYYFNELNQDRVWKAFEKFRGPVAEENETWLLQGKQAGGGGFGVKIAADSVSFDLPAGSPVVKLSGELGEDLGPEESGGLGLALALWKRLLTLGPQKFGDVYYQGTVPRIETGQVAVNFEDKVDVLVATYDVVRTKFMFDPQTAALAYMEMYPESRTDPCELYFKDYRESNGRMLPHTIDVYHGDKKYGKIQIDSFDFQTKPKTETE